jgi:hypothetical protein
MSLLCDLVSHLCLANGTASFSTKICSYATGTKQEAFGFCPDVNSAKYYPPLELLIYFDLMMRIVLTRVVIYSELAVIQGV